MSRSNPQEHLSNPATRWFEWNGEKGEIRYYDKEKEVNVDVPLPFTFILLDRLGTIAGWHDPSESGIYANEVKDTRQDVLVVKSFKGGLIAEGLYANIKDRISAAGGGFAINCYIAFKGESGALAIGSIKFKGCSLGPWMDFEKSNRGSLYDGAITIFGYTDGKKGRVEYRSPKLKLAPLSPETNAQAIDLDKPVQQFLSVYLKRNRRDQAEQVAQHAPHATDESVAAGSAPSRDITDDDIPFAWLMPLLVPTMGLLGSLSLMA